MMGRNVSGRESGNKCPHSDIRQMTPHAHLLRYYLLRHLLGVLCWLYPVGYPRIHSRFPSTLESSIFGALHLGGGISMTPARRNCRARSRTRIGYSTPFKRSSTARSQSASSHLSEARSRASATGGSAAVGVVLERSWARRPPLGSAGGSQSGDSVSAIAPEKMHGLPCFALEADFFQNLLTKVSNETL